MGAGRRCGCERLKGICRCVVVKGAAGWNKGKTRLAGGSGHPGHTSGGKQETRCKRGRTSATRQTTTVLSTKECGVIGVVQVCEKNRCEKQWKLKNKDRQIAHSSSSEVAGSLVGNMVSSVQRSRNAHSREPATGQRAPGAQADTARTTAGRDEGGVSGDQ